MDEMLEQLSYMLETLMLSMPAESLLHLRQQATDLIAKIDIQLELRQDA